MLLDYNPVTGLKTTAVVEDGEFRVTYSQDITPAMERVQKLRNADQYSRDGIKNGLWHAVHIPDVECMRMITEDGFDPYSSSAKEVRAFLKRNRDKYGHLFVTRGQI